VFRPGCFTDMGKLYGSSAPKRKNHYKVNTGSPTGSGIAAHTPSHFKKFGLGSKIKGG
jgi:hypothetical protein